MPDYNPHLPYILGNEWVPIQEPSVKLDRNVNNVELGTTFRYVGDSLAISRGQFYTLQEKNTEATTYNQINVYPAGQETLSGPIKKVRIPVQSASITGNSYLLTDNLTGTSCLNDNGVFQTTGNCNTILVNALNGFGAALIDYIGTADFSTTFMAVTFTVNDFGSQLMGKRILNVSLIHRGTANARAEGRTGGGTNIIVPLQRFGGEQSPLTQMRVINSPNGPASSVIATISGPTYADTNGPLGTGSLTLNNDYNNPVTGTINQTTNSANMGDVQQFWTYPTLAPDDGRLPWTWEVLTQFDNRNANNRWVGFLINLPKFTDGGAVTGTAEISLRYMAIEVTYCEETRIAVGGRSVANTSYEVEDLYTSVIHTMPLHQVGVPYTNPATEPAITAGNYAITVAAVHPGQGLNVFAPLNVDYPRLSATRPLYDLPTVEVVDTAIPFPFTSDEIVGDTFEDKPFKPAVMLSLVTGTTIALPQPHIYGRQLNACIYGSNTFVQFLNEVPRPASTWPYIRFWARRYGNTGIPLTVTVNSSAATITPLEFDALDEMTTDHWREVTLPLVPLLSISPPASGAINPIRVEWSATGELPGNRWEILGSTGSAVSGYANQKPPFYFTGGPAAYGAAYSPARGLVTVPIAGGYASTPDNAVLDILGDFDIRADLSKEDWTNGELDAIAGKWTGGDLSYLLLITGTGQISLQWRNAALTTFVRTTTNVVPPFNGERMAVRATLDVNVGGTSHVVNFYTAPSIEGPWTFVESITTASTTDVRNSASPFQVNGTDNGTANTINATIHAVQLFNTLTITVPPTPVLDARFHDLASGTTSFTDKAGLAWTINGSATIDSQAFSGVPTSLPVLIPDAAVLLSQTVPAVSGFAIAGGTQLLTGIGEECGDTPCCIPSELYYNRLTWRLPAGTAYAFQDEFDRTVASGWGNDVIYEPNTSSSLSVSDGKAFINSTGPGVSGSSGVTLTIDDVGYNWDLTTLVGNELATAGRMNITGRSRYQLDMTATSAGVIASLNYVLTNFTRTLSTIVIGGGPYTTGIESGFNLRYMMDGTRWKAKVWTPVIEEPNMWLSEIDTSRMNGLYLPAVSGSYASTPDAASLDLTSDLDLRADITMTDWTPGSFQIIVAKYLSTGNQRSYYMGILTGGQIAIGWSTNGTTEIFRQSTIAPPKGLTGRLAVRATLDIDNGAAGHTATFFTAPTMNGPWTQLGEPVVTAGVTTVFASTSVLQVGGIDNGTGALFNGTVHSVEVRNLINGTIVANPVFESRTDGTTSFADVTGKTWTVNGTAYIANEAAIATSPDIVLRSINSNISFQDLVVTPPRPWFGSYEIERRDEVETTWKTIMSATNPAVTGFNDYEARPGLLSEYRIRRVNLYDFPSDWSDTLSRTVTAPGAGTGECITTGHLLIFTSNERQDGSINLAYSSAWLDEQVEENFTFPESDFVQMQAMYDRDFYVAFKPLERGGEQFERTVLVQAAAIAPETLADFTSLRDMAWDSVNYICVRDEDGNRWLANVQVPSGNVLRNRRLYLAPVRIAEVTDTPTPVDPDPWS